MDLILPEKKNDSGRHAWIGLVAAFVLGMGVAYFALRPARTAAPPPPPAAPAKPAQDDEERKLHGEIQRLEAEIDRYYDAMELAEELGDRKRYMEVVRASADKNLEADAAWFRWQDYKKKKGLFAEGVKQAVLEEPPLPHFSNDDKFEMLANEQHLSVDTLRALKAEMEVLFADELLEKFGTPADQDDPSASAAPAA